MAKIITVIFKFDRTTDSPWLGMFDEAIKPQTRKEVATTVIISIRVKQYTLSDHQFIQFILDVHGAEVILQFPRNFVIGIVEGKNPEKLGF